MSEAPSLQTITVDAFASLVGQSLDVRMDELAACLEVIEAVRLPTPTVRPAPPFRVILASRERWIGRQGVYTIAHPTLGPLALFMTVLGPAPEGVRYEIIFN